MHISGLVKESLVDGLGVRTTIFISGCRHNCKGCQNPETHNFKRGIEFDEELQWKVIDDIKCNPLIQGITLSGGDPMFSAKELVEFVKLAKDELDDINIWCYTGFTYEMIRNSNDSDAIDLLKLCNVLVDGKFVEEQKDITLSFKGSGNQRVIDVKESLKQGLVVKVME